MSNQLDEILPGIRINAQSSPGSKSLRTNEDVTPNMETEIRLRHSAIRFGVPDGIPTGAAFTATLLMLREFMHHLQFASITVKV